MRLHPVSYQVVLEAGVFVRSCCGLSSGLALPFPSSLFSDCVDNSALFRVVALGRIHTFCDTPPTKVGVDFPPRAVGWP